jgi:hypothetical protein
MAGQLKVNGVTLATEESGTVTLEAPQIKDSSNNVILDQSGTNPVLKNVEVVNNSSMMFRNRIINGDMRIDQRNAGASVLTSSGTLVYTLDRWAANFSQTSKYTVQQNSGSVTPPAGFINYLGVASSSAYSVLSSDFFMLNQRIEGLNVADLNWGTANASTVTLSFWVRSSLTGTFGGVITNSAQNRSYPYTYTINSANTWEQKFVTVAGDTDTNATWSTDTGIGIWVNFGIGVGSTYSGTAGSWAGANYYSATGATSVVGTSGATFYITGVQLEVGTVATPFEHRPYELALCQRYYEIVTIPTSDSLFVSYQYSSGGWFNYWQFKQTKRTSPTVALGPSAAWVGGTATLFPSPETVQIYHGNSAFYVGPTSGIIGLTASAEL